MGTTPLKLAIILVQANAYLQVSGTLRLGITIYQVLWYVYQNMTCALCRVLKKRSTKNSKSLQIRLLTLHWILNSTANCKVCVCVCVCVCVSLCVHELVCMCVCELCLCIYISLWSECPRVGLAIQKLAHILCWFLSNCRVLLKYWRNCNRFIPIVLQNVYARQWRLEQW